MAYEPVLYDGTLPGPIGAVATSLSTTDAATHRQHAIDLYQFFVDPDKVLLQLNMDHTPRTCIVGMPDSHQIRVTHAIGTGSSGIGSISLLDNKLLLLTGDGGPDIGTPLPLLLPPETLDKRDRICLTQEQFVAQLTAQGANHSFPLVRRANASSTTVNVMGIAPIPAFLVLDGITTDLDAAILLERVLSLDDTDGEMYTHLKEYLRCVLTGHNVGDIHCRVNQATLNAPIIGDARRWANEKFKNSFPTIVPTVTQAAAPDYAAILAPLLQAQMEAQAAFARGHPNRDEEKKDNEGEAPPTLNMSPQEFNTTLLMCGLPLGSPPETLPEWLKDCSVKGQDAYKSTIIRRHIMNNFRYEDAEVQVTNSILKMAAKRTWAGKESNINRPSFAHASEGLSPFLMLDLSVDEVADINDDDDALNLASSVTILDIKEAKKRLQASVPTTAEKFLLLLQQYANLLFALFSSECPLYKCVVRIISSIKAYSREARDSMATLTKASILWVILKQSRRFAIGEMDILAEFTYMHTVLSSKSSSYSHAETPIQLYRPPKDDKPKDKRKLGNGEPGPGLDKRQKPTPQPRFNPNSWHPKLRSKLDSQMKATAYPSFSAIMKFCGTDPEGVYPRWHKKCSPNAFFGRCHKGSECTKMHTLPSDVEVEKILELTKKFQENHLDILKGQ
jgi:hypothetical protein